MEDAVSFNSKAPQKYSRSLVNDSSQVHINALMVFIYYYY